MSNCHLLPTRIWNSLINTGISLVEIKIGLMTENYEFKKVPSIYYLLWLIWLELTYELQIVGERPAPPPQPQFIRHFVLIILHRGRNENECSLLAGKSHRVQPEPSILRFFWTHLLVESLLQERNTEGDWERPKGYSSRNLCLPSRPKYKNTFLPSHLITPISPFL